MKKFYTTARANGRIPVIDGKLDDEAWARCAWEEGFIQRMPYEGRQPSEKTAFKILYDDKFIYVGIRAYDSQAATIERRMSRRDLADGDMVGLAIDSVYDHMTAFVFGVNAAGVKYDQFLANDGQSNSNEEDMSWDPIWDVATTVDKEGWTAEMRIPLSQIRFGAKDEQIWGLQVQRQLFRNNEISMWPLIPRDASGFVHFFGELRGLTGLNAPHQIEIMPYTVGSLQSFRPVAANPFATGGKKALSGGLDGKIGVTGDLTLNFTINPDFGQVEADPSVVNLTAYETFYTEKRPFFVEGKNIFNYQLMGGDGDFSMDNLFYSRRIGRDPHYTPSIDGYVDMPSTTAILGAFKLSGKTKSGLSIGVLETVTSKESASVYSGGAYGDVPVEPLTNYFALRVQQDWNRGRTILGGMFTAVNRQLKDGDPALLHSAAYAGGIDFLHTWDNKNYYFSLKAVTSRVQGTPDAILQTQLSSTHYFQRPDADYLSLDPTRTSLMGSGGNLELGKQGGGHWMYVAGFTWRSPGLELNDIGYLRQTDVMMQYLWAGYRTFEPFGPFRSVNINLNEWSGYNFGGRDHIQGRQHQPQRPIQKLLERRIRLQHPGRIPVPSVPARRAVHALPVRIQHLVQRPDRHAEDGPVFGHGQRFRPRPGRHDGRDDPAGRHHHPQHGLPDFHHAELRGEPQHPPVYRHASHRPRVPLHLRNDRAKDGGRDPASQLQLCAQLDRPILRDAVHLGRKLPRFQAHHKSPLQGHGRALPALRRKRPI